MGVLTNGVAEKKNLGLPTKEQKLTRLCPKSATIDPTPLDKAYRMWQQYRLIGKADPTIDSTRAPFPFKKLQEGVQ